MEYIKNSVASESESRSDHLPYFIIIPLLKLSSKEFADKPH